MPSRTEPLSLVSNMEVKEVDRGLKTVTIQTDSGAVMIHNNKIISQTGYLSPVEYKKVFKLFNAIIK